MMNKQNNYPSTAFSDNQITESAPAEYWQATSPDTAVDVQNISQDPSQDISQDPSQDKASKVERLSALRQEYQQTRQALLDEHNLQSQQQQLPHLLDSLGVFSAQPGADRLELIRRYAQRRDSIRQNVEFVSAKQLGVLLNENKSNWPRDLNNLRSKGKILAVKRMGANNWEYPVNQIDPTQGIVYPALTQVIPGLKQAGMSDWDILIWLNTPTLPTTPAKPITLTEDDSFDTLLTDFGNRPAPEQIAAVAPIELVQSHKKFEFLAQAGQLTPSVSD